MDAQGGKTIFCKMARPGQGEGKRGQGMVRAGHREGQRGQPECFFPPQPGSWFQRESHAAPETLWPSTFLAGLTASVLMPVPLISERLSLYGEHSAHPQHHQGHGDHVLHRG